MPVETAQHEHSHKMCGERAKKHSTAESQALYTRCSRRAHFATYYIYWHQMEKRRKFHSHPCPIHPRTSCFIFVLVHWQQRGAEHTSFGDVALACRSTKTRQLPAQRESNNINSTVNRKSQWWCFRANTAVIRVRVSARRKRRERVHTRQSLIYPAHPNATTVWQPSHNGNNSIRLAVDTFW